MAKPTPSPLVDAAAAFDAELQEYARLAELFLKTPLSGLKHLERSNATLAEIAACEERLQAAGGMLAEVIGLTREQQEQRAKDIVAHVPAVQARNQVLQDLMKQLNEVASSVGELNTTLTSRRDNGGTASIDGREVGATVLALSERAEQLASAARDAQFDELAVQAHSLHQRLQLIGKKLEKGFV
jgi:hypothetical protein